MAKKILIVDDEVNIVKILKSRLASAGYEVLTASDGNEGLERARGSLPDLIVLDLMLPKIDGYNVCRLLKFDKNFAHIPIIMMTAMISALASSETHKTFRRAAMERVCSRI